MTGFFAADCVCIIAGEGVGAIMPAKSAKLFVVAATGTEGAGAAAGGAEINEKPEFTGAGAGAVVVAGVEIKPKADGVVVGTGAGAGELPKSAWND